VFTKTLARRLVAAAFATAFAVGGVAAITATPAQAGGCVVHDLRNPCR
jgi:hypothetical protein